MIAEFGHFLLILALFSAITQAVIPLYGAHVKDYSMALTGRQASICQFILVGGSFCCLTYLYINSDFSVLNVEENGDFSDIFSNLLNSDNKLNFMNLVQTVGNKIQKKVEDGEFSQNDLFQDAQRMMSGLKNLQQTPEPTEPFNPTRDRLRKKLEQRKQKK